MIYFGILEVVGWEICLKLTTAKVSDRQV